LSLPLECVAGSDALGAAKRTGVVGTAATAGSTNHTGLVQLRRAGVIGILRYTIILIIVGRLHAQHAEIGVEGRVNGRSPLPVDVHARGVCENVPDQLTGLIPPGKPCDGTWKASPERKVLPGVPAFWIRLFAEKTGDRTVRGAFQFLLRNFLLQRIFKHLL
jgi:hypothetical protein